MSTEAVKPAAEEEPSVGGVKVRPGATLGLYALLVVSFAAALWAQRNPATVPAAVARGAPWVFLLFLIGFATYRWALVASHHYKPFKAFLQVAIGFAVFFLLLNPGVQPGAAEVHASTDLVELLGDSDPRVRALAAEVARYRGVGPEVQRAVVKLLSDGDETVRTVAHQTLVQFNSGVDLGNDAKAWRERFP